ncbi:MAG: GIY-YIG nuclease family protein [Firmicutes bacterium]|nr:GIY-YIG nuclease family protein [Bacillota bacterium]
MSINLFDLSNNSLSNDTDMDYEKRKPPYYSLTNIDFNEITRIARINFLETQQYRTIIKYVTRNYVKYPVYSDWKQKTKVINKSIKLTNSELENLNQNSDHLIRKFATDIIKHLNREELQPSWYKKEQLKSALNYGMEKINNFYEEFTKEQKGIIEVARNKIYYYEYEINNSKKQLLQLKKQQNILNLKLDKIVNSKHKLVKTIITLGIYKYFISNNRITKIKKKQITIKETISKINTQIDKNNNKITNCNKIIDSCNNSIEIFLKQCNDAKHEIKNTYMVTYNNIKPLYNVSNINEKNNDFKLLKSFSGYSYKKIIGVYIIHNRENDKYYIGQSKDILKRIKQHFNGTIPKNYIFAEDYYTSKYQNKEDLFEIKIIPCETKDELDKLEKKLISEYDSWNNGYNGTSGNL